MTVVSIRGSTGSADATRTHNKLRSRPVHSGRVGSAVFTLLGYKVL
jgi:hypothetical protein